ncbi:lipopolysaccharide assembly protein LapB [Alkalihalobacillus sp. AL-G]|uniref:tetratricopeptide repeat protein n=1 Tax=Alkalihalobacillus sp. AL-G TaxID=2926399 RepID=UPI00272B9986|nr:tetratricopeptide repeat protein [Alkalihalobacillus sp. AL-G]WLD91816.1 tetratricopeptide repeat protein [Alkalihalobacillus sp. AL-G]
MPTLQTAIEAIDQGEIKEGLALLKQLRDKSDHETLLEIAQLYYELGFIEEAIDVTEELIAFYPDVNELKVFAAELNVEVDREEEALDLLSTIHSEDAEYLQAMLLSADLYERQGLAEVAEQKLLEAKRHAPNEPVVSFGLGEFYLFQGNFHRGVLYYQELYEQGIKEMNGISVLLRLAESLSGSGAFEEALRFYEEGINEETNPDAWFGYGLTATRVEEYQKAINAFNRLKDLDPQYTTLYPLLAKAYEEEGANKEAVETYLEGIRLDEFNEDLYLQAGRLALRMNDFEKGEELLKHTLSINPANSDACLAIMTFYATEERYEELIDLGIEVERYGDIDHESNWRIAQAYRELENDEIAIKRYETAYNGLNDRVEFLEDYGTYMLEIGQRNEAIALYKRALDIDPSLTQLEDEIMRLNDE